MSRPVVSELAEELYEELKAYASQDEAQGWPLLKFCEASCMLLQGIVDLAGDTGDAPGWSQLVDLARTPDEALPWYAQMVGVPYIEGIDPDEFRQRIDDAEGIERGTKQSIIKAVTKTLTGNQTVIIRERYDVANPTLDKAYHLTVYTLTDETPNPTATLAAILSKKPAGIVLHYQTRAGKDYQDLANAVASYTAMNTTYDNYDEVAE